VLRVKGKGLLPVKGEVALNISNASVQFNCLWTECWKNSHNVIYRDTTGVKVKLYHINLNTYKGYTMNKSHQVTRSIKNIRIVTLGRLLT